MGNRNWNLSHLYESNDEFEKDLKIVEKYLENIKKLFLNTVHHIKKLDKAMILIKFLNTFIG